MNTYTLTLNEHLSVCLIFIFSILTLLLCIKRKIYALTPVCWTVIYLKVSVPFLSVYLPFDFRCVCHFSIFPCLSVSCLYRKLVTRHALITRVNFTISLKAACALLCRWVGSSVDVQNIVLFIYCMFFFDAVCACYKPDSLFCVSWTNL